jgi:hypothetical protein
MILQERINAFVKLGDFLSQFSMNGIEMKENIPFNDLFFDGFKHQIKLANEHNGWFNESNILFAINNWSNTLNNSRLTTWLNKYNFNDVKLKNIAIVMAGNIPLVGFHDFISVLLSGHNVVVKLSSNDKQILPFLVKYLEHVEPNFKGRISFTEGKLEYFDAVIATGSNNTARYFEYYFKNKPSIIRKNRNSIAVLNGHETESQLAGLSEDIFRFYGLGCRNVSKLFVPRDYNFDAFFNAMYAWRDVINDHKYANNYDYNKAVYLMSEFNLLDNGFMMLKEDQSYASPIATVFYEYYTDKESLLKQLQENENNIQCIVSEGYTPTEIKFGETQQPSLSDYADGIDTIDFLIHV